VKFASLLTSNNFYAFLRLVSSGFLWYFRAMSLTDRLVEIRKALNVSQKIFAKGIFISTSYLGGIETGHRSVNNRIVDLVCKVYGVNKQWFLTGEGEMFSSPPPDLKQQEILTIYERLNGYFQAYILDQIRGLDKLQENETKIKEKR
jgi:transcriptional regulator with XRE-family HTH domain